MTEHPPDPDDPVDEPSDGEERFDPEGKFANPAIYASNWKSVIVIDAMLGVFVAWAGFLMLLFWNVLVGAFVGALGLTYLVAVGRRFLQWRWLRQQAGLDV